MRTFFIKNCGFLKVALVAAVTYFSLTPNTFAQSYETIKSFDAQYRINTNGVVSVQESINYFFSEPRHGIIRDIPYEKKNDKGQTFLLNITNINVALDSDNSAPFSISKSGSYYHIKIGDPNSTIKGTHTYVISYQVHGALTYFEDHDEFYWNVTGNEWQVPIEKATAAVSMEPFVEKNDLKVVCYTGSKNSSDVNCENIVTNTPTTVTQTSLSLGPTQGLTIAVSFPKDTVALVEPQRDWLGVLLSILIKIGLIAWYVLLPLVFFYFYIKEKLNVKNKQRIVAAWFSPPKKSSGEFFTPAETGYLYAKKIDNKFITATLISLAQRGFIKIHVKSKDDITFVKMKEYESDVSLYKYEADILDGLFTKKSDPETNLKDIKKSVRFAGQVTKFKDNLGKSIKNEHLFKYDPASYFTVMVSLGFVALFITGNIPLGLVMLVFLRNASPRTDLGIGKYSEAASLKNFLVSQDEQLDYQAETQVFFEKLLPYATAFGVEDVWIKRFGNLDIHTPDWYEGDISNFYALNTINHSIASAISSSTVHASSRSSSGFSSGFSGGSSGGGGGGGGGSSW